MATSIQLGPFPKGVNFKDPPYNLGPDELYKSINWELDPGGHLTKRSGSKKFGTTPAKVNGDNLVNFLWRYYREAGGVKKTIACAGGKVYSIDDTTGVSTQIPILGNGATLMGASLLCSAFVYKDRLYILDGTRPLRYNNTDLAYVGHFTHVSSGWVATPGAGGSMTPSSTYNYIMTNVAGDMGEGPASAAKSVSLSGAQNKVDFSSLDSAPASAEATAKNLYRTKAGGSTYYFVAQLAAAATTYTDLAADSSLGAEFIPNHDPNNDCRFAVVGPDERTYWFGRAGANASLVEPSDPGFPDRILNSEFFAIANNDGDILTGGARAPNGILFFKRNSAWLLRAFGYGPDRVGNKIGTVAPFSICETPWGVTFLSQEGVVYLYNGVDLLPIGANQSIEFKGMTDAAMGRVFAFYENYRYRIQYDPMGTYGYNRKEMSFDFLGQKWDGPHENGDNRTPSYVSVWDSFKDHGEVLWGEGKATKGSYLYIRNDFDALDDGVAKVATAIGSRGMIKGRGEKLFYKVAIKGTFSPDTRITVAYIGDDNVETEAEIVFSTGVLPADALILDQGNLDQKVFWDPDTSGQGEEVLDFRARGRTSQFKITDKGTSSQAVIEELLVTTQVLEYK